MYSYITSELPKTVFENFKEIDGTRVSIFGHSMGGHGALTLVSDYYQTEKDLATSHMALALVLKESGEV